MQSEAELLFWEICFPFMTNNKNLGKRVKNQNHNVQYTGTQQIHLSDVSLYPTLTIQASSRLKRSANHLWNNSYINSAQLSFLSQAESIFPLLQMLIHIQAKTGSNSIDLALFILDFSYIL
jgi:hypothetical protein